jgi:iron-sulfur cluster repair protein YtfE (RIC family)
MARWWLPSRCLAVRSNRFYNVLVLDVVEGTEVYVSIALDTQSYPPDLFDVLGNAHRDVRIHLGKLTTLVAELKRGGAPNDGLRREARELIAFFSGPAREHNYDEELHVFPTLLACDDAELRHAAEALGEDHAWIELCWLDIEAQLALAGGGSSSYDGPTLRAAVESFITGMTEHMALEESLLYPQLRRRLDAAVRRSISSEIAARRAAGPQA